MMRSSNSTGKTNSGDGIPLENGLSQSEDGDEAHKLAAKVVDTVVKLASDVADQRSRGSSPARTPIKLAELKKLPTIQIDTVPSPPWSPSESSSDETFPPPPPPLDADQIELQLQEDEQIDVQLQEDKQAHVQLQESKEVSVALTEEERDSVKTFVEEILAEAMVVAEKKLKFVGLDDDEEQEDENHIHIQTEETSIPNQENLPSPEPVPSLSSEPEPEVLSAELEAEIREAAEKVVEEVLTKAQETAADQLAVERPDLDFPITFDEAPDDVKDVASSFIKDIVGKAITMVEEKAVPTVPFNFDVDLIKASGPWYVRVREGFMRVLRSACFCTPRRNDS